MDKVLEKSLKDARKEGRLLIGAKRVLHSMDGLKLVVLSRSVAGDAAGRVESAAGRSGVPLVRVGGTSVALGKMCGLQFRASTAAFTSLAETNLNSILSSAGSSHAGGKDGNGR